MKAGEGPYWIQTEIKNTETSFLTELKINYICRSIDGIFLLINGINKLINCITRLINGIRRLIDGIIRLVNAWGARPRPQRRRLPTHVTRPPPPRRHQDPGQAPQPLISRVRLLINWLVPWVKRLMPLTSEKSHSFPTQLEMNSL